MSVPLGLLAERGARRGPTDGRVRKFRHRSDLDRSLIRDSHLPRAFLRRLLRRLLRRVQSLSHGLELATERHDGGVLLPRWSRRVTKPRHIKLEGNHGRVVQLLGRRLLQLTPRCGDAPEPLHVQRGEMSGERGALVGPRGVSPARGTSAWGSRGTTGPVRAPRRAGGMARTPGRRRRRVLGALTHRRGRAN